MEEKINIWFPENGSLSICCFAFLCKLYLISLIYWRNNSAKIITCMRKKYEFNTMVAVSLLLLCYPCYHLLWRPENFGSFSLLYSKKASQECQKWNMPWSNLTFVREITRKRNCLDCSQIHTFNSFQLYFKTSLIIFSITRDWSRIQERFLGNTFMAELFYLHYTMLLESLHKSGRNSLQITIKYLQFPLHSYRFPLESQVILQNTFFTVCQAVWIFQMHYLVEI